MKLCNCGEPSEWLDEFCQMCWEEYCSKTWWDIIFGNSEISEGETP